MARRVPISTITIISFVGLYLMTCIWSFAKLSKDDAASCNDRQPPQKQQHDDVLLWRRSLLKSAHRDDQKSQDDKTTMRSPSTPQNYNFTAAVCVCVKDAEAYLEEFIDYHLAMGFSNIYVYDDSPNFELQRWYQHTRDHPLYQAVEILHFSNARDPDKNHKSNRNEEASNDSNNDDNDDEDDDDSNKQKEQQQTQQQQ